MKAKKTFRSWPTQLYCLFCFEKFAELSNIYLSQHPQKRSPHVFDRWQIFPLTPLSHSEMRENLYVKCLFSQMLYLAHCLVPVMQRQCKNLQTDYNVLLIRTLQMLPWSYWSMTMFSVDLHNGAFFKWETSLNAIELRVTKQVSNVTMGLLSLKACTQTWYIQGKKDANLFRSRN